MKILKTVLLLSLSMMLFGCGNSKQAEPNKAGSEAVQSDASKSDSNKADNNKLDDDTIQSYFSELKRQLPMRVSSTTQLVDLTIGNNVVDYKYVVTGNKKNFSSSNVQKMTSDNLKNKYCENRDPDLVKLRNSFPDGINHHYYFKDEDKELFSVHLVPSDCDAK